MEFYFTYEKFTTQSKNLKSLITDMLKTKYLYQVLNLIEFYFTVSQHNNSKL